MGRSVLFLCSLCRYKLSWTELFFMQVYIRIDEVRNLELDIDARNRGLDHAVRKSGLDDEEWNFDLFDEVQNLDVVNEVRIYGFVE